MKQLKYQQNAIAELTKKVIRLLNRDGRRRKIVFKAPTGSGKTVMACQALADIADELRNRGKSRYQEVAYIWFAPRKLHLQSYAGIEKIFGESRRLRPVMFDELEPSEGIQSGEILFVNWESVNKENNLLVRESESGTSLYEITRRTREEFGLPIVAIIDEEHMFWSKTADKSAQVLDQISPAVELRISATPKTTSPDELVQVYTQDVVKAEMIKKEVVLNLDIELDFREERTLNESLIQAALKKREQLAKTYSDLNIPVNPLLLIQLPNDTNDRLSEEDEKVAEFVKEYLRKKCEITVENGLLAVWLANEKENLANLERPDNMAQVLLFKEAIALGWDCPRAAVLLIFRKMESYQFTIQTVGRIMRMPEQKHYQKEPLNIGYVYTDIAKEKIQIVTADTDYIRKEILTARRREALENVSLPAYYAERPNVEQNYLGPDFKKTLYRVADEFFKQERGAGLFSDAEMAELVKDDEIAPSLPFENDDETINENRKQVENLIRLDVKTINVEIPQDVHFQNELQTLEVQQVRYARKKSEIDRVFMDYIGKKGNQFESRGRTDKIAFYLIEMLEKYFRIDETDAKKVVLFSDNRPKFDLLLEKALEIYAKKRESAKARSAAAREFKRYNWEVPEERIYDSETNHVVEAEKHAMQPFVQLNEASNPEKNFIEFLEQNSQYIDWWYKNGDKGKQHFAVVYGEGSNKALFYVDFIIRMKNGHLYLFDTKSAGSDPDAPKKHNALLRYIQENTTSDTQLYGGVVIQQGSNWLYSTHPIENTENLLDWKPFYPETA